MRAFAGFVGGIVSLLIYVISYLYLLEPSQGDPWHLAKSLILAGCGGSLLSILFAGNSDSLKGSHLRGTNLVVKLLVVVGIAIVSFTPETLLRSQEHRLGNPILFPGFLGATAIGIGIRVVRNVRNLAK